MITTTLRFLLLTLLISVGALRAQDALLTEYKVGDAGCMIGLPKNPTPVVFYYSADSSKVFTIDAADTTEKGVYHFGAIVVQLRAGEADEEMVNNYMEYLQLAFNIHDADGTSVGYKLATHPSAAGVADVWYEKDGDRWSVVGWAAEGYMIIQYVYGAEALADGKLLGEFLKSARFPGDK